MSWICRCRVRSDIPSACAAADLYALFALRAARIFARSEALSFTFASCFALLCAMVPTLARACDNLRMPPPPKPATVDYYQYTWCQVRQVFARELQRVADERKRPMSTVDAYAEGGQASDALRQGLGDGAELSWGAGPGRVDWQSFACFAYDYASRSSTDRAYAREALRGGTLLPFSFYPTVDTTIGSCPHAVEDDPEYATQPGCYPPSWRAPIAAVAGGLLGGAGIAWLISKLLARRGSAATSGSAPRPPAARA